MDSKKDHRMENSDFHQFFVEELKDIYWAEKRLLEAMPKFQKASTSKELAAVFEEETSEIREQITQLERVFDLLGEEAETKKCEAMEGLLKEAQTIIDDTEKDTYTRDAGLILAAQKIEHYEIATYGTLRIFARQMGHMEVEEILDEILQSEKDSDVHLTRIAEDFVNEMAAGE